MFVIFLNQQAEKKKKKCEVSGPPFVTQLVVTLRAKTAACPNQNSLVKGTK